LHPSQDDPQGMFPTTLEQHLMDEDWWLIELNA
jgi:hypothetical protein